MFAQGSTMKLSKGSACYQVMNRRYGMQMDEGRASFVSPRGGTLSAGSPHNDYECHKNHAAMEK
jgi:hypothetical protein